MKHVRIAAAAVSLALAAALAGCSGASTAASTPTPTPTPTPEVPAVGSLAVVGDSISVGMSACGQVDVCPAESWAIGTDPVVDSIATRLADATGVAPQVISLARPGATAEGRAAAVVQTYSQPVDLVLVLVGANDACTSSAAEVTPVDRFAQAYAQLLGAIGDKAPDAEIVALSVPDLLQLWETNRGDAKAVALWNSSPSCRSLLADADSDAPEDVARRAAIADTLQGYNAAIAAACAAAPRCTSDDGAVYDTAFSADEISSVDHFHPSILGQAQIAAQAWPTVLRALGAD